MTSLFNAPQLYDIDDIPWHREAIFKGIQDAVSSMSPVKAINHVATIRDVEYEPAFYSKDDEKKAILSNDTLYRRLRGTIEFANPVTGEVELNKRVTLAKVPYLTDRGTFIFRGNDYTLAKQMRLRPGVYVRRKESGEIEAHANVSKGLGHRYMLDPATGVFYLQLGQARMPLLPVLKTFGIGDGTLRKVMGNELYSINARVSNPAILNKLAKKLAPSRKDNMSDEEVITSRMSAMQLDPAVSIKTLGSPYANISADSLLAITKKLIAAQHDETLYDDRDALPYQQLVWPDAMFVERIRKFGLPSLKNYIYRTSFRRNTGSLIPGTLDEAVWGTLLNTGLGAPIEEVNPAEVYDQWHRLTRLGAGGLETLDAVPIDSRMVQPTHLGYIDIIHTPEGSTVGIDNRLTYGLKRDKDGNLYTKYIGPDGAIHWLSPRDIVGLSVKFPEIQHRISSANALKDGELIPSVTRGDITLHHMVESFSPTMNLIPLKAASFPQRISMAVRHMTQALPLTNSEAPLVQSGIPDDPDNRSFEQLYGDKFGNIRSPISGIVIDISPGKITIKDNKGNLQTVETYNNLLYNRKTFINNKPVVTVGTKVKAGDLLANSNFTDKNGISALGLNARVAFTSWQGKNYEDAMIVSESFANRATSEHAYQNILNKDNNIVINKNKFIAIFPSKYQEDLLKNYNADGTVKEGTVIKPGDPLILAVQPKKFGPIVSRRTKGWSDASVTWDHDVEGVVTDVFAGKDHLNVIVKSTQPLKEGDKLANRYGNKGVVSVVVPDDRMPKDEQGRPFELLLNPLGIISRGNASQIIETVLGKVAAQTGRPYKISDFHDIADLREFAETEARKTGVNQTETIYDPDSGKHIKDILTGMMYMHKLHHTAEAKLQGRGIESYSSENVPAKGGTEGAKRLGMLEVAALLSHGAFHNLKDASLIRGQKNDDYWRRVMSGYDPPDPSVPFVYRKFLATLQAAGIQPIRRGSKTKIMAMTNRQVDELVGNREIKNAELVDWKSGRLAAISGGLFDERLTGGHGFENRWSYIKLKEPMPNPVMEEAITKLLDLTKQQYRDIIAGKTPVTDNGKAVVGPKALNVLLSRINVDKAITAEIKTVTDSRLSRRDKAIKKLHILMGLKANKQHPTDWMWDKVPVIPPAYRPVSIMPGHSQVMLISDVNKLYQDLFSINTQLNELTGKLDDLSEERLALYDSIKAVAGLGEPISPKTSQQRVKGLLKQVFGASPKFGMVQRKLIGSTVDLVGRGVITPNPKLDIDEVGLPIDKAMVVYRPFVIKRLVQRGFPHIAAMQAVLDNAPVAVKALEDEVKVRPVLLNRAPTLHRFGILAMKPVLVAGSSIQVPPPVTGGFAADFDGDALQFHVPASKKAVQEAYDKMLPSKNLVSPASFKTHIVPPMEFIGGLYLATADVAKTPPRTFVTKEDAIAAYRRGDINANQKVIILQH